MYHKFGMYYTMQNVYIEQKWIVNKENAQLL